MKEGPACGGPADGQILKADDEIEHLLVPVKTGPDRGEGDRGFSAAVYKFKFGVWLYEKEL